MAFSRIFLTSLFVFLSMSSVYSTTITCLDSGNLEQLVTCKRSHIPPSGSNKFVIPTASQLADIKSVITQMMSDHCTDIVLPTSLSTHFQVNTFFDTQEFCVFHEVMDADDDGVYDKGWLMFIRNPIVPANHELIQTAPHPLYDIDTEIEAVTIFRATNSRGFLMSGTHRNANSAISSCVPGSNGDQVVSDPSYNTAHPIFAVAVALRDFYGTSEWYMLQWHGMGATSCSENVMGSQGVSTLATITSPIRNFNNYFIINKPSWVCGLPTESSCTLLATTNVVGRLLNGVAEGSVCSTSATSVSGHFVHHEQDPTITSYRDPSTWSLAVNEVFESTAPTTPLMLSATPGSRKITLKFASVRPVSYTVEQRLSSSAQFTTIASSVTDNTYTAVNLVSRTTYCFHVSATNVFGTTPYSSEMCATAK